MPQFIIPASGGAGNFIADPPFTASGSAVDGGILTINGPGGFGVKTNVKPLYWIPCESNLSPHPTLSRNTASLSPAASAVIDTTIKPPNAAGSGRNDAGSGDPDHGQLFTASMDSTFTDCYIFLKRYVNHSIDPAQANFTASISGNTLTVSAMAGANPGVIYPLNPVVGTGIPTGGSAPIIQPYGTSGTTGTGGVGTYILNGGALSISSETMSSTGVNDKITRLWSTAGVGSQPDAIWQGVTDTFIEGVGVSNSFYDSSFPANFNTWYTDEHLFRQSSLNNTDGYMQLYRNGLLGYNFGTLRETRTTGFPQSMAHLFLDEYSNCAWLPGGVARDWKHAVYVDDSHQRAMVSNEVVASEVSSTREICIPTAWSDTSVSAVIRQGALPSLSGEFYWIWTDIFTRTRVGRWV